MKDGLNPNLPRTLSKYGYSRRSKAFSASNDSTILDSFLVFARWIMLRSLKRLLAKSIKPVWSILIRLGRNLLNLLVKALEMILKSALRRLIGL